MNFKYEKIALAVGASWQILDGFITMFLYGGHIKNTEGNLINAYPDNAQNISGVLHNSYTIVYTFGILLLILGLSNLYIYYYFLRKNICTIKISYWFIGVAVFSYIVMDIISVAIFVVLGLVCLAKTKATKKLSR